MKKTNLLTILSLAGILAITACGKKTESESESESESIQESEISEQTNYVTNIALSTDYLVLALDSTKTAQLTATVTPNDAYDTSVTWSSSDETIASVVDGLVTAKAEGDVTITATSVGTNANGEHLSAECEVEVKKNLSTENITSLAAPSRYTKFQSNVHTLDKISQITASDNPDGNTFYENDNGTYDIYKVGDDNPFKFKVTATATDSATMTNKNIQNPELLVKLEIKADGAYSVISDADLANYVSINDTFDEFDFAEGTVGEQFRLTLTANDAKYESVSESVQPVSIEFEVVDAYNVYSVAELSLFHNQTNEWDEIKEAAGIKELKPNGLVLQNDLSIDATNIPSSYLYDEDTVTTYISNYGDDFSEWCTHKEVTAEAGKALLVGSTKDKINVFSRTTSTDDDFTFEGNYFTINSSNIPLIYSFADASIENHNLSNVWPKSQGERGSDGSHAQLFGFNCNDSVTNSGYGGEYTFKNVNIIGNGERSSEEKYMGGLMTFKVDTTTAKFINVLSSKTFMTYMSQISNNKDASGNDARCEEDATYTSHMYIDRSKNFDSYNSLVYVWGTSDNVITNSFMKGAGGAIFLMDEVNYGRYNESGFSGKYGDPHITSTNVYYENWVSGNEAWFTNQGATALVQSYLTPAGLSTGLIGKNAASHGSNKTITKVDSESTSYVNIIVIDITGSNTYGNNSTTGKELEGTFTIDNSEFANETAEFAMSHINSTTGALYPYKNLMQQAGQQGFVFESNKGGSTMIFPDVSHGATYTGTTYGFTGTVCDDTFKYAGGQINTAVGTTVFNTSADLATVDALGNTTFCDDLASGSYMNVYVQPQQPSGGTYYQYLGVMLGTTTYNF